MIPRRIALLLFEVSEGSGGAEAPIVLTGNSYRPPITTLERSGNRFAYRLGIGSINREDYKFAERQGLAIIKIDGIGTIERP